MSVLAIDTSSRAAALVVRTTSGGDVLDLRRFAGGRHDVALPAAIGALLEAGLEAVVVLTGPGSYTGVRAGMAAALGIATGRDIPLHGLGTLAAVAAAAHVPDGEFVAVSDAGRGGAYVARYLRRAGSTTERPGTLRRVDIESLGALDLPLVATSAVPGVEVLQLSAAAVLAAAVPVALRLPSLQAVGLAAITVRAAAAGSAL